MIAAAIAVSILLVGGVLGQAVPPLPRGGAPCSTAIDCELLGTCVQGKCSCDPGWTGRTCGTLRLLPARRISAELCFKLNAAHFTASASTLMLAECSAMCRQVGGPRGPPMPPRAGPTPRGPPQAVRGPALRAYELEQARLNAVS